MLNRRQVSFFLNELNHPSNAKQERLANKQTRTLLPNMRKWLQIKSILSTGCFGELVQNEKTFRLKRGDLSNDEGLGPWMVSGLTNFDFSSFTFIWPEGKTESSHTGTVHPDLPGGVLYHSPSWGSDWKSNQSDHERKARLTSSMSNSFFGNAPSPAPFRRGQRARHEIKRSFG